MNKTIANNIVFLSVIVCFLAPLIYWFHNMGLTQIQVFARTWLFLVYGFVIYVIGTATVKQLFD